MNWKILLCKIGLHDWEYCGDKILVDTQPSDTSFRDLDLFILGIDEYRVPSERKCRRCGKHQKREAIVHNNIKKVTKFYDCIGG